MPSLEAKTSYVIIWEFYVRDSSRVQFEQIYGENGAWSKLMRSAKGYSGSSLHRDLKQPGRYLCIDCWDAAEDYQAFRLQYEAEYKKLDCECEELTEREIEIGVFGAALP